MFELDTAVRAWRRDFARERSFTTPDLDELEDHLRAAYEVELDLNPGLAPSRAFSHACETLGAPEELSGEFAKVEGRGWRRMLKASWVVFGLSFLLPVHRYGARLWEPSLEEGVLPGIQAFLVAMEGEAGAYGVVSALTNALLLLTLWRMADAGLDRVRLLCGLLFGAMIFNLWWLVSLGEPGELLPGYYAWVASFGLGGGALSMRARTLPERERSEDMLLAP